MSLESILRRISDAFETLNRLRPGRAASHAGVRPGRPRAAAPSPAPGADLPGADGFDEEAMPWLGAVYRFAVRLTRGDDEAAQDLVQETYLRAFRAWHQFERGTNCRSWLFTICKNTFLRERERARTQREITESELDADTEMIAAVMSFERTVGGVPGADLFEYVLDARVVEAIDALSDEFRDVLVLSDLGDLTYGEIAQVIGIPVGTVKSRLFRARRILQEALVEQAVDAGYVREESA